MINLWLNGRNKITSKSNLYLPLYNKNGRAFSEQVFKDIRTKLIEKFKGLTIYTRNPAIGFWKDDNEKTVKDDVLIYEIITTVLDEEYWKNLKTTLMEIFNQDEVMIKITPVQLI